MSSSSAKVRDTSDRIREPTAISSALMRDRGATMESTKEIMSLRTSSAAEASGYRGASVLSVMATNGMRTSHHIANTIIEHRHDEAWLRQHIHNDAHYASLMAVIREKEETLKQRVIRALAADPPVLLMDEPASALDPISTAKVEELIHELKKDYTIVIVTHNMQQAARVSDKTAFFYMGEMVEFDQTKRIFTNPEKEATQNYITGRFG